MSTQILVIDDDVDLNGLLTDYLSGFSYEVVTVVHPAEGLRLIKSRPPDLVILDIMLPDMDGFEVCREIRKMSDVPIIMLTARGEVTDRIVGLEMGADDYLPKPFEPRELQARIHSILRRLQSGRSDSRLVFGTLVLDPGRHTVCLDSRSIDLTTMEFEVLSILMNRPGILMTRDRIMNNTHNLDWNSFNRTVDVIISRIRQKLNDDPKNPQWIKTIWGSGYKFIGDETDAHTI
ncbi:response regulator transcription factor [bacterium]|nr:response regulator transcription factor [bacterium]